MDTDGRRFAFCQSAYRCSSALTPAANSYLDFQPGAAATVFVAASFYLPHSLADGTHKEHGLTSKPCHPPRKKLNVANSLTPALTWNRRDTGFCFGIV